MLKDDFNITIGELEYSKVSSSYVFIVSIWSWQYSTYMAWIRVHVADHSKTNLP